MIHGFHVTISVYGHWLPNDPRGSGSRFVGSEKLFQDGGRATKTESKVSVAHEPHDVCLRLRTKSGLKHPPILFNIAQIDTITSVLHLAGTPRLLPGVRLITCAVVPDHVHFLIGPTRTDIEEVVLRIKEETVKALLEKGIHPRHLAATPRYPDPLDVPASVWSVGCWKVYANSSEHLEQTKRYIERHLAGTPRPLKARSTG